jgi:hypothetical protein
MPNVESSLTSIEYFETLPIFGEVSPHLHRSSQYFNVFRLDIQVWGEECLELISKFVSMSRSWNVLVKNRIKLLCDYSVNEVNAISAWNRSGRNFLMGIMWVEAILWDICPPPEGKGDDTPAPHLPNMWPLVTDDVKLRRYAQSIWQQESPYRNDLGSLFILQLFVIQFIYQPIKVIEAHVFCCRPLRTR